MNRYYYILLFLLPLNILNAQKNLVPNAGFEDYNFIPIVGAKIDSACKKWFTPWSLNSNIGSPYIKGGSSDYYHRLGKRSVTQIPYNGYGYQNTTYGNAYSGICLSESVKNAATTDFTYKEYIEIELRQYLINNKDYCIKFHYNISNDAFRFYYTIDTIPYYPIKLGILLTDTIVKRYLQTGMKQPLNICASPEFETSLVSFKDTVNWIHVQGSFTAKGGERYLTIGNFECNPTDYNPDSVAVYIYIDDVRLYECNPDSANEADSLIIPNIFTPNGDGYNDKFEFKNQEQWKYETQIFGRWGNLLFDNRSSENWDGYYKNEIVSPGVYFYVIRAVAIRNGEIRVFKGTISVMY